MESTERKCVNAMIVADCDQGIEHILSEYDHEVEVFITSTDPNGHFRHVAQLVSFERIRRQCLIDQLESPHPDCEDLNAETVVTWAWAGVMILGLLALMFGAVGIIAAVRYLFGIV